MVIDSSVLIAILCEEPERFDYIKAIGRGDLRLMSIANALEATIANAL